MADILSQAEIEALLASLTEDGSVAAPAGARTLATPPEAALSHSEPQAVGRTSARTSRGFVGYKLYDFRRPDKFAKDQLRTLQMLHETFARLLGSSLSGYLRTGVHADLVSVGQLPYEEFMRSITSSVITIFSMPPLVGQALMEIEFNVVLAMIDRLLGGPGNMSKKSNVLTDIEKVLTETIINRAFEQLQVAWEGIAAFTVRREATETQAQFVQIVPPNDVVISVLFEIQLGDIRGAMSLCIPYVVLKPITEKLSALRWFASSMKVDVGQHTAELAKRLEHTRLPCSACLGGTTLTVREILDLKVGDIITLNRSRSDELELLVGSKVKFHGKPCVQGKKLAIYVTEAISQPDDEGPGTATLCDF